MTTVYLDEELRGLGFSGRTVHDDGVVHMTVGSTNSGAAPRRRAVWISLRNCDLDVYGGPAEVYELHGLDDPGSAALRLVARAIAERPEVLLDVLEKTRAAGVEEGRRGLRTEFRELMGAWR